MRLADGHHDGSELEHLPCEKRLRERDCPAWRTDDFGGTELQHLVPMRGY